MNVNTKDIIRNFIENGYLLSPDFFEYNKRFSENEVLALLSQKINTKEKPLIINKDLLNLIISSNKISDTNWVEFEKSKALVERGRDPRLYNTFIDILNYNISEEKKEKLNYLLEEVKETSPQVAVLEYEKETENNVIILKSYKDNYKKREVQDFIDYYNNRYEALKKILLNRTGLQNTISISRILNKSNREDVSIIGIVNDKIISKNDNIILILEDVTGQINVLINKNKSDLYEKAKSITLDEVIGVTGVVGNKIIFGNNIFFPDVVYNNKLKKCNDEGYVAFISDIHVGSKLFLKDEFMKFISWLNGDFGNETQREISKKIKYLFIVGDLVDGVGVYPGQEKELEVSDIFDQYDLCASFLKQIRPDIKIIICGGQHDALRLSEPQPPLDPYYAKSLYDAPNFIIVSNPSFINIHSSKDFEGFNVLMYHGASFHYYISNIDYLRFNESYNKPHYVMHYLLQKRHLAPTHASTVYIPDVTEDPLVIDKVPDIFVCGDMHRSDISQYNNIITINCSCWQAKTSFQEKIGNNPDPAKVPVLNLMTREVKVLRFGD